MNRSNKIAFVEIGFNIFPYDPEEFRAMSELNPLVLWALAMSPLFALFACAFVVSVFQARRALGSWTLALKVCMRKTAQSFAMSSPP